MHMHVNVEAREVKCDVTLQICVVLRQLASIEAPSGRYSALVPRFCPRLSDLLATRESD